MSTTATRRDVATFPATRRALLAAGMSALAIGPHAPSLGAGTSGFKLKVASNLPASHPLNVRVKEAAGRIAKESAGQVELLLFPSSQLGPDGAAIELLRAGAIELLTVSGLVAATQVPSAAVSGMGFAFNDYGAVWKAMDGRLGEFIRAELGKADLLAMPRAWDNGFRHITTSRKPIRSVDDLAGVKMRVPASPLWISMFRAFGASPTPVPPPELYLALQTGVVDGQENGLVAIRFVKLHEVQKFCALTNHMWDGYWMLASKPLFERMPRDIQEIIRRNLDAAAIDERADIAQLTLGAQAKLEQLGLTFNAVDKPAFQDKLRQRGFYREWRERLGPEAWNVLEASVGSLT